MSSIRSSAPTLSAPAASAFSALSPRANTATLTSLPVPAGMLTTPPTMWSACRGSTPRFIAISSVSSNLAEASSRTVFSASSTLCSLRLSTLPSRAFCFLVSFAIGSALRHFEAHRAGAAFDDLRRVLDVVGVQILHLDLGDLGELRARDLAAADLARLLRTRLQVRGLLDQIGRRGRLRDEGKALVGIDGDDGGGRRALVEPVGRGVERLAEFHDVDAALTQRRAERRRGVGSAGRHLQLDVAANLLGHDGLLSFYRPGRVRGSK